MTDLAYISEPSKEDFWIYDSLAGIDMLVEVDSSEQLQKAKRVANEAIAKWLEATDEDKENWYKGYAEVVQEALAEANIKASIYIKMEGDE